MQEINSPPCAAAEADVDDDSVSAPGLFDDESAILLQVIRCLWSLP
jgi:hypothetical protein